MKKMLSLLLVVILLTASLPASAASNAPTAAELRKKYPGYFVSDNILMPNPAKASQMKNLYSGNCCFLPAISLNAKAPLLMFVAYAGSGNVANYLQVTTDYAIYEFQTNKTAKKGERTTFGCFDGQLSNMIHAIGISDAVSVSMRSSKNGKAQIIRLNDQQRTIFHEFYQLYNELLAQSPNPIGVAMAHSILAKSTDYKIKVKQLKKMPPAVSGNSQSTSETKPGAKAENHSVQISLSDSLSDSKAEATQAQAVTYTGSNGPVDIKLHSGVRLGMTAQQLVQCETDAGCELLNAAETVGGIAVTPQTANTVSLPYGQLCYYGPVGGGDKDSHANSSLGNDDRILYRVQYFIRCDADKQQSTYDRIEASLKKNYGEATTTAAQKKVWEESYLEVPYSSFYRGYLSEIAEYDNVSRIADYSQWVIEGSDGSVILIEHVYQASSTNREYNLVNYALYKASLFDAAYSGEDDF